MMIHTSSLLNMLWNPYPLRRTQGRIWWMLSLGVSNVTAYNLLSGCLKFIPVKYIPEWFPGANFQKEARLWKASVMEMLHRPFDVVKSRMVSIPKGRRVGHTHLLIGSR